MLNPSGLMPGDDPTHEYYEQLQQIKRMYPTIPDYIALVALEAHKKGYLDKSMKAALKEKMAQKSNGAADKTGARQDAVKREAEAV